MSNFKQIKIHAKPNEWTHNFTSIEKQYNENNRPKQANTMYVWFALPTPNISNLHILSMIFFCFSSVDCIFDFVNVNIQTPIVQNLFHCLCSTCNPTVRSGTLYRKTWNWMKEKNNLKWKRRKNYILTICS